MKELCRFLKNLKSENGDRLISKRKGSIPGDGGSVDIYEVENENNEVENDDEPAKSKNQTKIAENEIKKHKDVLRKKIAFGYL